MKASGDGINETRLQPRILLVEPDQHLLNSRSLLLTKSNFKVLTAGNACEVYRLRSAPMVKVAVLSDALGDSGLRAAAECIREQWLTARILLLGAVQPSFEDYLYDEALDHRFEPGKLLDSICMLCRMSQPIGYWSHPDAPNQDQWPALLPTTPPENISRREEYGILSLDTSLDAPLSGQGSTKDVRPAVAGFRSVALQEPRRWRG
jgi:hypothetical protein